MRKLRLVAGFGVLLSTTLGGWAWGGIEGSKHDFSSSAWSKDDRCGACHTPHREKPPKAAPLWDPDADLSRTFGTANSQATSLGRGTAMCIRCHDGTIARDTVASATAERFVNKKNPGLFTTSHEMTDHPVGVKYPEIDKGYRSKSTVLAKGTVVLPKGRVECVSCHDPHDSAGEDYMLVRSNARSALCLTCHNK